MKKHFSQITLYLGILILFCSTELFASSELFIPSGTPFFEKPDIDSQVILVSSKPIKIASLESKRFYLKKNPAIKRAWHPLMVFTNFQKINYAQDKFAWVSEDLLYHSESKLIIPRLIPQEKHSILGLLALGVFLALTYYCYRENHFKILFTQTGIVSLRTGVSVLACIIFARYFLIFLSLFFAGNIMVYPTDEFGYFQIGNDILNMEVSHPWNYTLGQGLFYLPFIFFQNAKTFFDIANSFSLFNCLIIAPSCLIMIYYIIQKLTRSSLKAFIVVFLLSVLPFVYFPVELHSSGDGYVFKSFFAMPDFSSASYRLYYLFFGVGFNAMSDYPSTFCILSAILIALYLKSDIKTLLIVSAVFGFACMVRINNIFFAPLFAYLFWFRMKTNIKTPLAWIRNMLIAVSIFIVFFLAQFIANYMQFKSIFTFPYVLHPDGSSKGFLFSVFFSSGSAFLIGCNFAYMVLGAIGLLFMNKDKHLKIVLAFWALPVILFFCGYPVIGASPIRFILTTYGALLAMIVCTDYWDEASPKHRLLCVGILLLNCVLLSPCFRLSAPYQFNLETYPWGKTFVGLLSIVIPIVSLVLSFSFLRSEKRALFFILAFLVLFNLGSTLVVLFIFLGLLGYSGYHFAFSAFSTLFDTNKS